MKTKKQLFTVNDLSKTRRKRSRKQVAESRIPQSGIAEEYPKEVRHYVQALSAFQRCLLKHYSWSEQLATAENYRAALKEIANVVNEQFSFIHDYLTEKMSLRDFNDELKNNTGSLTELLESCPSSIAHTLTDSKNEEQLADDLERLYESSWALLRNVGFAVNNRLIDAEFAPLVLDGLGLAPESPEVDFFR